MSIYNSAPNQGAQGPFHGSVTFQYYFGADGVSANQAALAHDLPILANLIALKQSPATYAFEYSPDRPHIVLLAARDQASSAHYVAVVRAFAEQHSSQFAGGIFWFDQQAASDDILRQVTHHGRATAILARTDFALLDQAQQLAAVQRAWQEERRSLLIFSGIDSLEALQQLAAVLPRSPGSPLVIISRWHQLTKLIGLTGERQMQLLNATQIDLLYDSILAGLSRAQPASATVNPCMYLEAFPRVGAVETEDSLASIFHKPAIYNNLVSAGRRPNSHVIFGDRGTGKTILCKRLENEYRGQPQVLTVRLRTFSIQQYIDAQQSITSDGWIGIFIYQLLNALVKRLRREGKRRQKLQEQPYEAEQLMGLCAVTHIDPPQLPTPPDIAALCERIEHRGSFERLEMFAEILKAAGFAYALILIDDIDNQLFEDEKKQQAIMIIDPLIRSLGSVQDHLLAFKLFLPDSLRGSVAPGLTKFMNVCEITWTDDDLREILRLRLAQHSMLDEAADDGLAESMPLDCPERFDLLCESNVAMGGESIDDILIRLARQRPGRLMDIINQILARHCSEKNPSHSVLIRWSTINDVLKREAETEAEESQ